MKRTLWRNCLSSLSGPHEWSLGINTLPQLHQSPIDFFTLLHNNVRAGRYIVCEREHFTPRCPQWYLPKHWPHFHMDCLKATELVFVCLLYRHKFAFVNLFVLVIHGHAHLFYVIKSIKLTSYYGWCCSCRSIHAICNLFIIPPGKIQQIETVNCFFFIVALGTDDITKNFFVCIRSHYVDVALFM